VSQRLDLIYHHDFFKYINYSLEIRYLDINDTTFKESEVLFSDFIVQGIEWKVLIAIVDGLLVFDIVTRLFKDRFVFQITTFKMTISHSLPLGLSLRLWYHCCSVGRCLLDLVRWGFSSYISICSVSGRSRFLIATFFGIIWTRLNIWFCYHSRRLYNLVLRYKNLEFLLIHELCELLDLIFLYIILVGVPKKHD